MIERRKNVRQCSKPGCHGVAVATLTYDYGNSTVVIGPVSRTVDPHALDFCEMHAETLTVPKGWDVIRLQSKFEPAPPSPDDLLALVEAVREVAGSGAPRRDETAIHQSTRTNEQSTGVGRSQLRQRFTVIAGEGSANESTTADSKLGPLAGAEPDPLS